jgi:predicted Zn-ribbon and HTH transcriptional regulator
MSQRLVFEQMQKKALREILRIVRRVPTIPNKRVNRVPVQPAKLGQCGFGTRRLTLSRKQHHAPPSGAKSASGIRWRMMVRVQL